MLRETAAWREVKGTVVPRSSDTVVPADLAAASIAGAGAALAAGAAAAAATGAGAVLGPAHNAPIQFQLTFSTCSAFLARHILHQEEAYMHSLLSQPARAVAQI